MRREHREAAHILKVVPQHILKEREFPGFEEVKVPLGHLSARKVVPARLPQHGLLEGRKIAAPQAQLIDPPGRVQQIQMRPARDAQPDAVHDHPRFQQRQIEALAVEGHYGVKPLKELCDFREHGSLLAVIAHHILPDHHAVAGQKPHADLKRQCARAAAEARRLRVQKQQLAHVPRRPPEQRVAGAHLVKRRLLDAVEVGKRHHVLPAEERLLSGRRRAAARARSGGGNRH